jgi:glutamate-1-semialdehyde 2,1-aminomutase
MLAEGLIELGLTVSWVTGLLTVFFRDGIPADLDQVRECDFDRYGAFCRAMLERGVYLPPSQYEAWFPSLAHTEEHVERTLEAAAEAVAEP